jgi:hypothetical protein
MDLACAHLSSSASQSGQTNSANLLDRLLSAHIYHDRLEPVNNLPGAEQEAQLRPHSLELELILQQICLDTQIDW